VRRLFVVLGLLVVLGAVESSCYVTPVREDHCRGGYWVEGHRGPRGRWREAHWRCPGVIEIE
jgi:hypothetical protein